MLIALNTRGTLAALIARRQLHTSILPPQLFGELGPLAADVRTAAAVALEASATWSTTTACFDAFLRAEPAVARALLASLAKQVIATGGLVDDLRGLDLRGRLAKRLLALVTASFDRLPSDGTPIPALVTQADLASLANGSREQVTRILSDLERAGVIGRQGRRVVLRDVDALAGLAGLRTRSWRRASRRHEARRTSADRATPHVHRMCTGCARRRERRRARRAASRCGAGWRPHRSGGNR